jgi:hypothetical protein
VAVSYEAFLERFPQFTPGGTPAQQAKTEAMIRAELTHAARQVNATVWGDHADDGIGHLAAHRVAKNPGGQFARPVATKGASTPYLEEYERLQRQLLIGDRVV